MRVSVAALIAFLFLCACNGEVYLRDGVTDGDTFYLADRALADDDAVLQSWVRYSLSLSTCKLGIGGENPARASSFACEFGARQHLLESWREHRSADATLADDYLDGLALVEEAGWLREYVARFHGSRGWAVPDGVDVDGFRRWQRRHLPGFDPETRLIGSWNYARKVRATH